MYLLCSSCQTTVKGPCCLENCIEVQATLSLPSATWIPQLVRCFPFSRLYWSETRIGTQRWFPESLQYVHVSPVQGSPDLDLGLQASHQGWAERKDHLPRPAGNALCNAAQDTLGFFCHKGTLLSRVQLGVYQDPQVLFSKTPFQLMLIPRSCQMEPVSLGSCAGPSPFPARSKQPWDRSVTNMQLVLPVLGNTVCNLNWRALVNPTT